MALNMVWEGLAELGVGSCTFLSLFDTIFPADCADGAEVCGHWGIGRKLSPTTPFYGLLRYLEKGIENAAFAVP